MTLIESAVIAAARYAAPLQSDLVEAGRNWRRLLDLLDLLDGVKREADLLPDTATFLREVALGQWRERTRYQGGAFLPSMSLPPPPPPKGQRSLF